MRVVTQFIASDDLIAESQSEGREQGITRYNRVTLPPADGQGEKTKGGASLALITHQVAPGYTLPILVGKGPVAAGYTFQ